VSKPKEACGLFGIIGADDAVETTYYGLFCLQHRGQESAGIASVSDDRLVCRKGMGLVAEVFNDTEQLRALSSRLALGHVRYSTTGESEPANAQPIVVRCQQGHVALGHNGNLVNRRRLRRRLESQGSIFATSTDSEVVLHLLARQPSGLADDKVLSYTLAPLRGAFSLLMMWPDRMVAVRDPWGLRPLWYGRRGDAHVFASETAAFDIVGAEAIREVEPGTYMVATEEGVRTVRYAEPERVAHCMFEHVYFARPDSRMFGDLVQDVRTELGRTLAREHPVEADMVCAIPDSGNAAALGYSLESGIPLGTCFVRNHYIGRTFINPSAQGRVTATDLKLNLIASAAKGKRIVVIDDSIVRGTTAARRIQALREAGAKEIHFRVSCPPILHPCHYGIDFQSKGELIAGRLSIDEIREYLGLDSLGYVSLDGMLRSVSKPPDSYCTACWSGDYPVQGGLDEELEV